MTVLECRNLNVGYTLKKVKKELIRNLNFKFEQQELVSLLGANGIGKSSLLKTLIGNLSPLSGSVLINNKQLTDFSSPQLARQISFVNTKSSVAFNPSVFEFVALGRTPYLSWNNILSQEDEKQIYEALALLQIEQFTSRKINTLSDGERQKVAIAKALCQDTPIILFDEPTAFLDIENKFEIIKLLRQLSNKQGKTILFSSHDIDLSIQFSDKIIILNNENFVEGSPEKLMLNHEMNELFTSKLAFFDEDELRFRAKSTNLQNLKIINKSDKFRLKVSLNALRRISLMNEDKPLSTEITIIINPDSWKIRQEQNEMEIRNINEFISEIKHIIKKESRPLK